MRKMFLITAATLGIPAIAHADETIKFRTVIHAAEPVKTQEVGDVDGHRMLLVRNVGLASFPDGSVGTTSFVSIADIHKESSRYPLTYINVTTDDGSVLWLTSDADATNKNGTITFNGTVSVFGGKERFAGVKGEGTVVGQRLATGDAFFDLVVNLK